MTVNVSVDLFNWERRADAAAQALLKNARNLAASGSYTVEGRLEQWERMKQTRETEVEDLAAELRLAERGAKQILSYARAKVMGAVPDPAKPDAAVELAAARVLARHEKWNVETVTATLDQIIGTETAALVMDELVRRGEVDAELLDALVEKLSPTVAAARVTQKRMLALIGGVCRPLLEELEELLERGPLSPAVSGGKVQRRHRATLAETVSGGAAVVYANGKAQLEV